MKEIIINSEFIKLDQFLKYAEIVSTGGEAKNLIMDGEVKINNTVEFARGKKIHVGDIIEFQKKQYKVVKE
ncbi:MAG: RNA-binding S4 domain-containing protein [Lutisporaceae bacterium]